jgi:hypothetical protein
VTARRVAGRAAATLTALVALASCGGTGATDPPSVTLAALPQTAPPQCKHQRTTHRYAQIKVTLRAKQGLLCIPEFGGWGGTIAHPGVHKPVVFTLRTSTQNIYYEPQMGSGNSLVYLNLRFSTDTRFDSRLKAEGGLTSEQLTAGQTYTAFGIVQVGHLALRLQPCYAVATSGAYGGVFPNTGELLAGATITGAGYGVIEIYQGMQASEEC